MTEQVRAFRFIGSGNLAELLPQIDRIKPFGGEIGDWAPDEDRRVADESALGHPAGYISEDGLVEAVNTALILGKPLLLTGNSGTGKSELAERLAWELNLGPVLRFEAQSTSEAGDLFYRFDLVAQMAANELLRQTLITPEEALAKNFLAFGPLGKAIVAADPAKAVDLSPRAVAMTAGKLPLPRPSVVLIDEIDKTTRDFPNDLLNGIDRMTFDIRELGKRISLPDDASLRPIVVITSNSERDLPDPFLRRCVFHHIADPKPDMLRRIVMNRVFRSDSPPNDKLPTLYEELLGAFGELRKKHADGGLFYMPGTSELLDWTRALKRLDADAERGLTDNFQFVEKTIGAVIKHRDDITALTQVLARFKPVTA